MSTYIRRKKSAKSNKNIPAAVNNIQSRSDLFRSASLSRGLSSVVPRSSNSDYLRSAASVSRGISVLQQLPPRSDHFRSASVSKIFSVVPQQPLLPPRSSTSDYLRSSVARGISVPPTSTTPRLSSTDQFRSSSVSRGIPDHHHDRSSRDPNNNNNNVKSVSKGISEYETMLRIFNLRQPTNLTGRFSSTVALHAKGKLH